MVGEGSKQNKHKEKTTKVKQETPQKTKDRHTLNNQNGNRAEKQINMGN